MKKWFLLGMLMIASFSPALAETPGIDSEVPPAPVVSSLFATTEGDRVTLSWEPVPSIRGTSIVLRSDRPITASNYLSIERVTELPYTTTTYTDTPENTGNYYYAVLSVDDTGVQYDFFLPASNSLLVPVSVVKEDKTTLYIHGFDTVTRNDAVIATWNSSRSGKNLILYRSTQPFTGIDSLVSAIVVATIQDDGSPYVDYPVPGVPYYYAIIDETSIRSGSLKFSQGENTSRVPVEISARFARIQRNTVPLLRSMPLPWLNPGNQPRARAQTFSRRTEQMLASLVSLNRNPSTAGRIPYVFTMDLQQGAGGEELALRSILETSFFPGNWESSIQELKKFLAIRRTPATAARARFYIGEAYYFSGNYREALLEFCLHRISITISQENGFNTRLKCSRTATNVFAGSF